MTQRERRVVLGGLALSLVALAGTRLIPRLVHWVAQQRAEVAALSQLALRQRQAIASGAQVSDSAASQRRQLEALGAAVLAAHSDEEALEELSLRLGTLARRHDARLERTEPMADSLRVGFLRRVTIRTAIESDLTGLLDLLHSLGRDSTALGLSALRIAAADPQSLPTAPEVLRSELTISGWYVSRQEPSP